MSKELKHVDESRGYRGHQNCCEFEVVNEEFVGVRGGRKLPIEIVWKHSGSGLGTSVFRICGCSILFPRVRYHNGDGKPRTMYVEDWVKLTGQGSYKHDYTEEFKAKLQACEVERSKYSSRTFEIVKSILDNGGTLTISSR